MRRAKDHPMPDQDVCICGVERSEHALCGCREGCQTPEDWEAERQHIISESHDEMYGDYQP